MGESHGWGSWDWGSSGSIGTVGTDDPVCLQCTSGGILRGSGNQKVGAIFNAIGYYVIGLPIGISLMFATRLGVMGKLSPWAGRAEFLAALEATQSLEAFIESSGASELFPIHSVPWQRALAGARGSGGPGLRVRALLARWATFHTYIPEQSNMPIPLISLSHVTKGSPQSWLQLCPWETPRV